MDCDDCRKIMCIYRGKRKCCTEKIKIDIDLDALIKEIKEEGYYDWEGLR